MRDTLAALEEAAVAVEDTLLGGEILAAFVTPQMLDKSRRKSLVAQASPDCLTYLFGCPPEEGPILSQDVAVPSCGLCPPNTACDGGCDSVASIDLCPVDTREDGGCPPPESARCGTAECPPPETEAGCFSTAANCPPDTSSGCFETGTNCPPPETQTDCFSTATNCPPPETGSGCVATGIDCEPETDFGCSGPSETEILAGCVGETFDLCEETTSPDCPPRILTEESE